MSTPRPQCKCHCTNCCTSTLPHCGIEPCNAEGVAAPLEPTLEESHHWKWFREIGQKLCPQAEQQWHKKAPHLCRPCEFAKKVAELYAAKLGDTRELKAAIEHATCCANPDCMACLEYHNKFIKGM